MLFRIYSLRPVAIRCILSVADRDCKRWVIFFRGTDFGHPRCAVWMFLLCILITDRACRLAGALPVARGKGVLPLRVRVCVCVRACELGDEWKPEELAGDMHNGCSIDFICSCTTIWHVIHVSFSMKSAIKVCWGGYGGCKIIFRMNTV
jgi:hypothetical protein